MDTDLVQHLRYKLQRRVRRINSSTDSDRFETYLRQFIEFINRSSLLKGVVDDLRRRHSDLEERVTDLLNSDETLAFIDEGLQAAFSHELILRALDDSGEQDWTIQQLVVSSFRRRPGKISKVREDFFDHVVEYLYDYIDEQIDDQRALLAFLRRYKRRCEWFNREKLFQTWKENTQRGERLLAKDLYRYLYDQGIEFSIEPESASGRADLVKAQTGEEPLVADVKLFHPGRSKGRSYLRKGFSQIYEYTQEYNQPFGYLVIFNICKDRLDFALSGVAQTTPFIEYNNKTLFFVEVDIYPYETSASERGTLKTREITEDYLRDKDNG